MKTDVSLRFPILARLVIAFTWLWLSFALVFLTDAGCMFLIADALVGSGLFLSIFWMVLTGVWPYLLRKPFCILWLTVPLAGMIGVGLALTDVGFQARVTLSEWALGDDVERIRVEGIPVEQSRTVGLFRVEETRTYDD